MPRWRFVLLCLAVLAQASTIGITWELWQPRGTPPNLPLWAPLAYWSFGPLLLGSLGLALLTPRWGWLTHVLLLGLAIAGDQFRLQPQFLSVAILIWAAASPLGWRVARWYLVALWLWAGLHKALSPDWWNDYPWSLLTQAGISPEGKTFAFAAGTIAIELALGILAVWRPRWAIPLCLAVHLGIVLLFSPWLANRNFSVLPWNLLTAIQGSWILWTARPGWPALRGEQAVAGFLLLSPALYYSGWLDRSLAHVLYAGHVPRGIVARGGEVEEVEGWGRLAVPFPSQERLLLQYFELTAQPGERLVLKSPFRSEARTFLCQRPGIAVELFPGSPAFQEAFGPGNYPDDPQAIEELLFRQVKLLRRTPLEMIYAAEIPPEAFHPRLLKLLAKLPNLEQLQLRNCPVSDDALPDLLKLHALRGIGLEGTQLSSSALEALERLPQLEVIER